MSELFNVYCDESCHLENDQSKAMVIGALWCPAAKRKEISERIREIKLRHKLTPNFEIKWTKVSKSKLQFYLDCIDYFFDDDDLHFRAVVIPDKSCLNHSTFKQNHDEWYYKMYFTLLKVIFEPAQHYHVYLDIKDTRGSDKVKHLHDILCHNAYDYSQHMIQRIQQVRSDEVTLLQLADLMIGALGYLHRELESSPAKLKLIRRIQKRSGYNLKKNTLLRETKVNLLIWSGRTTQ
jgi:hypothetical protein